eukprot:CFRG2992T1
MEPPVQNFPPNVGSMGHPQSHHTQYHSGGNHPTSMVYNHHHVPPQQQIQQGPPGHQQQQGPPGHQQQDLAHQHTQETSTLVVRGGPGGAGGNSLVMYRDNREDNNKRQKRLERNKEAARQCRVKKKEYIKCLEGRVKNLEQQNLKLMKLIEDLRRGGNGNNSNVRLENTQNQYDGGLEGDHKQQQAMYPP